MSPNRNFFAIRLTSLLGEDIDTFAGNSYRLCKVFASLTYVYVFIYIYYIYKKQLLDTNKINTIILKEDMVISKHESFHKTVPVYDAINNTHSIP